MLQGFGMISLMMYALLNLFIQEEVENLRPCKSLPTLVSLWSCFSRSPWCLDPCNVSDLMIVISYFWHYTS